MVFSTGSFFDESLNGLRLDVGAHLFEVYRARSHSDRWHIRFGCLLLKNCQVITTEAAVLSFEVADDFPRVDGWHYRPAGIVRPKTKWRCVNYRSGMTRFVR